MSAAGRETLLLKLPPDTLRAFRDGARALNLTLEDYLIYLILQLQPGPA